MTASRELSPLWARTTAALRGLSATPLIQSGLSLVTSTILASGLGFLFWILAARSYSPAEIGVGSAVITAMILISDVSHLGLRTGLVRFCPTSGSHAERLILASYGIAMIVAGVGATIFVMGLRWWVPDLRILLDRPAFGLLFVAATIFWVVFQLQDSVLLGLRLAPWVPVENGIFGLVKIILLLPLAGLVGEVAQLGVFLAWSLPVFVIVAAVTVGIIRVVRSRAGGAGTDHAPQVTIDQVMRYSIVDWTATVSRSAAIGLLPILVLDVEGTVVSAYFAIAWTIAYSVHMLSANVADALLAEASYDRANVDRHTLQSGLLSLAISGPIVLVAVAAAPWVLAAFGSEYADGATGVLRVLLITSIPNIVTRTYIGRLRAQGRMHSVFRFEAVLSLSVVVLGWLLLQAMGIIGVALAWLIVLSVAAGWVLAIESIGWWSPRLDPSWRQRSDTTSPTSDRVGHGRAEPTLDRPVEAVLAGRYSTIPAWHRLRADEHSQTVRIAGHEGRPPLVVQLASTPWGAEVLARRVAAVNAMGDLAGLASFRALVPFPIEHRTIPGEEYLFESALSGRAGDAAGPDLPPAVAAAAVLDAVTDLHDATSDWLEFGSDELDRWVARPLKVLGDASGLAPDTVMALGRRICDGLEGRRLPAARLHGNLVLSRARFDPVTHRLTGLVDWEWSDKGPVFLDWCTLALSSITIEDKADTGIVVDRLLEQPEAFTAHPVLAGRALPAVDAGVLLLLAWLHTLVPVVRSAPSSGPGRQWLETNVEPVVTRFLQTDEVFQR